MAGGSWKVAYADFVTAMMAFFLLMWLLATPEDVKKALAGYFATDGGFSTRSPDVNLGAPPSSSSLANLNLSPEDILNTEIHNYLKSELEKKGMIDDLSLTLNEAGVLLRANSGVLFGENQTDISVAGVMVLNVVREVLLKYKVNLVIRGHADMAETGQPKFNSNWELSAARAGVATAYLVEKGRVSASSLTCTAFADTRPVVPEALGIPSAENRRVEFFFYRPENKISITGGY